MMMSMVREAIDSVKVISSTPQLGLSLEFKSIVRTNSLFLHHMHSLVAVWCFIIKLVGCNWK